MIRKTVLDEKGFQTGRYNDYNIEGKLIGFGSYAQGLRNGLFQSFHHNGKTKSYGEFYNDKPVNEWKYYDDNGRLIRHIIYHEDHQEIKTAVGKEKKQVINGNGKFKGEFYSLVLNQALFASGQVVNGLMEGKWRVWEKKENGEAQTVSIEYFDNGRFIVGSLSSSANRFQREYHSRSIITFLSPDYYFHVEKGVLKPCSELNDIKPKLQYIDRVRIETLVKNRVNQKSILNLNSKTEQLYRLVIENNGVVKSVESIGLEPIYPIDFELKQVLLRSKWKMGASGMTNNENSQSDIENINSNKEVTITLVIEFTPLRLSNQQSLNEVPFIVSFKTQ